MNSSPTLYLDLVGGISGDMFLAAMIDLGVDAGTLQTELAKLDLHGYEIVVSRCVKSFISGVKFDIRLAHAHHHHSHAHSHDAHRHFSDIKTLIANSRLSPWVKQKSVAAFTRIAEAEGKIHGIPVEEVHFHEIGAVDSILDIVGAAIALEMLGKPLVLSSPVCDGSGWIDCAHGRFPLPAPATLGILGARGIAITQCDEPNELVTPTGAALLAEFVECFGLMENLVAGRIGFGHGTRENKTRPNVLRAVLGRSGPCENRPASNPGWETDSIAVLETNLDDCTGEILGAFMESALQAGALDVFHTPIQMKKNRPGVNLTILCDEAEAPRFAEMILRGTTAFGLRQTLANRYKLSRQSTEVQTPHGAVTVKLGQLGLETLHAAPEFESVKKIAADAGVTFREVLESVAPRPGPR